MHTPVRYYFSRYKVEIVLTAIGAIISALVSLFLYIFPVSDVQMSVNIIGGTLIIVLLIAILFNLKRLLTNMFANLPGNIERFDPFKRDKYWERLEHFAKEKELLAEVFVASALPNLVDRICSTHKQIKKLNIILDSGTTITPIFKHLVFKGIKHSSHKELEIVIFTNNLAGIEEIHKIDTGIGFFQERDFNLIGGKPLNAYRATTGQFTQNFLRTIWEEHGGETNNNQTVITMGVLTANWLTCGNAFKKISIVAKGDGHLDFKSDVIANSHYLFILSPLGKLLPLDDYAVLNELVKEGDGSYRAVTVPDEKKERTFLLTSLRPKGSVSPLYNNSIRLAIIRDKKDANNFVICDQIPQYEPTGDRYGVTITEVPHQYVRDNFERVFLFPLKPGA